MIELTNIEVDQICAGNFNNEKTNRIYTETEHIVNPNFYIYGANSMQHYNLFPMIMTVTGLISILVVCHILRHIPRGRHEKYEDLYKVSIQS